MAINTRSEPNLNTISDLQNRSFDGEFDVAVVEMLTYNPLSDTLERVTDIQGNASYLISYNAAKEAVYVDTIISGVTYRQTFTRGDMVIDSTLPISAVEII